MTRYTLTLPLNDNEGHTLESVHRQLRYMLALYHGGFTATPAGGGWFNPETGSIKEEPVLVYTVDVADPPGEVHGQLVRLAEAVKELASQDAVYLTRQDVTTWLV